MFFYYNDSPATAIYTLSLHDALPIYLGHEDPAERGARQGPPDHQLPGPLVVEQLCQPGDGGHHLDAHPDERDRKSTRLNSSHVSISYAVFCLKKKKTTIQQRPR